MHKHPLTCLAVILTMSVGTAAFAQATGSKPSGRQPAKTAQPAGDKPAADKPSTSDKPADAGKGKNGYPDTPKKQLYADNDLRGKPAPEFKVEKWITDSGEPNRKDKTVLIDFWATWCGPCKKLIPELAQWQKEFKNDLVVICVSDEPAATVENFVKHTTIGYAIATDTKAAMKNTLRVKGIPHVLVISSDGIVRWQGLTKGETDQLTTEKLKQIIDADKAARAAKKGDKADKADKKDSGDKSDKPKTTTDKH
jgi:cytochrome c biogenesis protein CcmG/thiol:disulfide interchange protein DsbE